jgi:predicted dehydrogenase
MVLDDFRRLTFKGLKEKDMDLGKQEKGHYEELQEFVKLMKTGKSSILTPEDGFLAMNMSLLALESARTLKPVKVPPAPRA